MPGEMISPIGKRVCLECADRALGTYKLFLCIAPDSYRVGSGFPRRDTIQLVVAQTHGRARTMAHQESKQDPRYEGLYEMFYVRQIFRLDPGEADDEFVVPEGHPYWELPELCLGSEL